MEQGSQKMVNNSISTEHCRWMQGYRVTHWKGNAACSFKDCDRAVIIMQGEMGTSIRMVFDMPRESQDMMVFEAMLERIHEFGYAKAKQDLRDFLGIKNRRD